MLAWGKQDIFRSFTSGSQTHDTDKVLYHKWSDFITEIELNQPKALNALD